MQIQKKTIVNGAEHEPNIEVEFKSSVTTPANLQLTVTCDGFEMPDNKFQLTREAETVATKEWLVALHEFVCTHQHNPHPIDNYFYFCMRGAKGHFS